MSPAADLRPATSARIRSAVLTTAGLAMLALAMARRGVRSSRMFVWTTAAFAVCLGDYEIRAQSFGFLFFAVTLWLVAEDLRVPRPKARTWTVIGVLVLWANTHGSVRSGSPPWGP
jgi:hypothetical protein